MDVDSVAFDSSGGIGNSMDCPSRPGRRNASIDPTFFVDRVDSSLSDQEVNLHSDSSIPFAGRTSTISDGITKRLGINIVSIIIGALFFVIAFSWVEALRVICESVTKDEPNPELDMQAKKKWWMGITITLLSIFFIILLYTWFTNRTS